MKINLIKIIRSVLIITFGSILLSPNIFAQSLTSTNYTLINPSIDTNAGITTSTNYSALDSSDPVGGFLTQSSNYTSKGGAPQFFEANVPSLICLETTTTSGSTVCTGVPGGNGMVGVCALPGCYDRAKFEINAQGNAADARYALQVSTTSDFSSNIFYVTGSTHLLKATLAITDFLRKCNWEGTIVAGQCGAGVTTWTEYNLVGLNTNTIYYVRGAALKGSSTNGSFTQSPWGPSLSVTTSNPTLSLQIDIGPTAGSTSTPPAILTMGSLIPTQIITSTNYIIFRTSSNAINGLQVQVKGLNGSLLSGGNSINAYPGNLASQTSGYGLRNDNTTNSSINTGYTGNISVSTSPIDFTDPGGTPQQVGGPTTSYNNLYNSSSLPLNTGVSAYLVKAIASNTTPTGSYSETLTTLLSGSF